MYKQYLNSCQFFKICFLCIVTLAQLFSVSVTRASEPAELALNVQLTGEEQRYLILKKKITFCGDPDWMPYSKNVSNELIGMTADYVNLFSTTLNIPFEFVPTHSWGDTLKVAKSRDCDLVTALVNKPDRREYLDFTEGYLDTSLALATLSNAPMIDNLKALDGKAVAVVKGYASTTYIRQSYPNLKLIEVANLEQGLELVADGKSYGVAGTLGVLAYIIQNHYFERIKINGTFADSWKQSIGTRNDEPLLHNIMSKLANAIPESTHQRIFNFWLSESVINHSPNELTFNELEFIESNPTIRFRVRPNGAPFEYQENGEAKGLAVDYITLIANQIGFNAEFVATEMTPSQAIDEIDKQERLFDTVTMMVKSEERSKRVLFGDVYLSYPMVIISHKDSSFISALTELKSKTVVLERGYLTNKWLARDYPDIQVINAVNSMEALRVVDEGKADAYIGNLAIANYLMASGELKNIKVAAPTEYGNVHFSFVAPKQWPELASILSKGYKNLSPSDHMLIREKWFTLHKVETIDYTLLLVVLIAATMLLVASAVWNTRVRREKLHTEQALEKLQEVQDVLRQKNEELKLLSDTDALTGLCNRAKIESVLHEEIQTAKRYDSHDLGVVMVDIDRFKSINDTHGHQTGDEVLKHTTRLFKESIRSVDYIGRWGGEEFLIVCPHTDKEGVMKLAEHLRELLEACEQLLPEDEKITASFGSATYGADDTADSLVSRADKALYLSKNNGRNRVSYL
ncbi:diguanylate cyclase [Vibrio sp. HN007]|uniref:diguanylate cyclase n=1 Tax=Vibrio iocasae TaxID=3098914 RepID=UPI0035D4C0F5